MSQTWLRCLKHLEAQSLGRSETKAEGRSAQALGMLRANVCCPRPSPLLGKGFCSLSGTWRGRNRGPTQRVSKGGVACQGNTRLHRACPCPAQLLGGGLLRRPGKKSKTQRGGPRESAPLAGAAWLARLRPRWHVQAVPEHPQEAYGSNAGEAGSACPVQERGSPTTVGAASLGPLAILRADYAAWQAWYEEQQDFPARLLRVLSDGGSAAAGLAVSWGQPERSAQERQRLVQAGATLAALLFFGSSEEKMAREIRFYRDGTVLLVYQLRQDLPLLGDALAHAIGAAAQPADARRLARLRRNLVSLLPFVFLVVNTFPATPVVLTTLLRFVPRHLIIPAAYDEERLQAYQRLRAIRVRQASKSSLPLPTASDGAASRPLAPSEASTSFAAAPVRAAFWWEVAPSQALAPAQQAALVVARLLVWQWGVGLGWGWGYGIGWSFNPDTAGWEVSLGWGLGWGWGWGWWL